MNFAQNRHIDPETFAAVIAHSQIVLAAPGKRAARLPARFDDADAAVLDWIIAEGRRFGRGLVRM